MQRLRVGIGGLRLFFIVLSVFSLIGIIVTATGDKTNDEEYFVDTDYYFAEDYSKADVVATEKANTNSNKDIQTQNVMMSFFDYTSGFGELNDKSFGYWANDATKVVFEDSYPSNASINQNSMRVVTPQSPKNVKYVLDISAPGCPKGSVVAYLTKEGKDVILHIAGKNGPVVANENSLYVFKNMSNVTEIDFKNNYDTSNATTLRGMFLECRSLKKLDLSTFNTSNVENMVIMFGGCEEMKSVDLSSFDTKKVLSFETMFLDCFVLEKIDLSSFDTANAEKMAYMFEGCLALSEVVVSNDYWNLFNVDVTGMFKDCPISAITYIN